VSDPVFDPVVIFNMDVYRGVVSRVTPSRKTNICINFMHKFLQSAVSCLLISVSARDIYLLTMVIVQDLFHNAQRPGRVGSGYRSKILTRFHLCFWQYILIAVH